MFVLLKIWHALFSWNTLFKICPFALLLTSWHMIFSSINDIVKCYTKRCITVSPLSQREDFQDKCFNLPLIKRVLLLLLLYFAIFVFLLLFNVSLFHTDRVKFFRISAHIYLLKNNRKTSKKYEICSVNVKDTTTKSMTLFWSL